MKRNTTLSLVALGLTAGLLAGCTAPTPVESTPEPRKNLELTVGALLPETGALASFGPATRAAVQLAVDDIDQAGLPITITPEFRDAGDSTTDTGLTNVTDLLDTVGIAALVGPLSDGVAKKIIDAVVDADVPMISPGNTAPDFTSYDDDGLYWRTVAPCSFEGDALAQQVADSGAKTVAVVTQTEACGEGLAETVISGLERREVEVAATASLDDGGTVDAAVATVTESAPDAVAVITTQGKSLIAPLAAAGFTGDQLFFTGLPIADYAADFAEGTLEGAIATLPGPDLPELDDFTDRLLEIDPALVEFSHAAETYDAVILLALAALAANDDAGDALAAQLQSVSGGADEGEPCDTFEQCGALIVDGSPIDYEGVSGSITFDDNGDPLGAVVGVFQASRGNVFERLG